MPFGSTQESHSPAMQRYGMVIGLEPDKIEEYRRLHAAAWPGVLKMIRACNIRNYSIYLRRLEDGRPYLFSYFEYIGSDFDADMARMAVDALRLTQTLQREQQGHSSLYSLLALSRQQQRLAGRKTILFFSEGIQVPPTLEHVLSAAISEANRAKNRRVTLTLSREPVIEAPVEQTPEAPSVPAGGDAAPAAPPAQS